MPIVESLTFLAALAQPSAQTTQTTMRGRPIGGYVQQDTGSWIFDSLNELDAFLNNVDVPLMLRPTGYAYFNARKRLVETSTLLNGKPEIILDGEGGVDIEWMNNGRLLMFSCRANSNQRDYIYFQENERYGGGDYSSVYSTDRLNWLLKG